MVPSLDGARVLLIAPRFFGYDEAMARELARRGAHVDAMADRPFDSPSYHAAARFFPRQVQRATERHYRRLLADFGSKAYDYVIVVNGQTLSPRLLGELRRDNARAQFIFYLWDSLANRSGALDLVPMFDRAFTFERETAARHGMRFRPLFFDDHAGGADAEDTFDISFVGTAHTDRHKVVERLDATLPAGARRFWYLYLKARWVLSAYRITNPSFRDAKAGTFRFEPLSRQESQRVFESSRAILDIEHARQTGLTMRTLEVLGAGKKLVTTNADIRAYSFYDPARIEVIDRARPRIADGFLEAPTPALADDIRYRYSIAGWIDELLTEQDQSAIHLKPGLWRG
ncbi:hypothetical protein A6F68_00422 [Tsuneonella dongtanensis]|uniref:Eps11J n=1 Tax=Tsuneonella dongtanensis TaxID=692370 RepID=A0A1B2A9W8_9SPHN|nr:hypothetical protein [Tsuneonella dongtanensis]ANY18957.1 hypothetical protein A6F68_00422 [Tsuneonella dongtanensis]